MTTRRHVHEEIFAETPDRLFALLVTPSAIRSWWEAASAIVMPKQGGIWAASWGEDEDAPEYVISARLSVYDPPHKLEMSEQDYVARSGPLGFEADFVTTFEIEEAEGGSLLRVTQSGFPLDPAADLYLDACERGWRETFAGIRKHVAQG